MLNLDKLFRRLSIILVGGFCGHGLRNYVSRLKMLLLYRKLKITYIKEKKNNAREYCFTSY